MGLRVVREDQPSECTLTSSDSDRAPENVRAVRALPESIAYPEPWSAWRTASWWELQLPEMSGPANAET